MAASCESRGPRSDPGVRDALPPGAGQTGLPRPLILLEPGRRRLVEHAVVPAVVHRPRGMSPACPPPASRTNNEPPGLSLEFDFFREIGLFQQCAGHPNALRVADPDDASLRGHVITL